MTSLVLGFYARQKVQSSQDLGIPSQEVIEKLEQDTPVVEEYAPASDAPELDASDADEPVIEDADK